MDALLEAAKAFLVGDPGESIAKIITAVHPTPEQKAEAEVLVEQVKQHSDEIAQARDAALEQYPASIQSDPGWKRAHGRFVDIVNVSLALNLIVLPLWNRLTGQKIDYMPLPPEVMHLFEITFVSFAGLIHGPDILTAIRRVSR